MLTSGWDQNKVKFLMSPLIVTLTERLSEAMEAAQSPKYFEVRSYLSRASVYEVRHII